MADNAKLEEEIRAGKQALTAALTNPETIQTMSSSGENVRKERAKGKIRAAQMKADELTHDLEGEDKALATHVVSSGDQSQKERFKKSKRVVSRDANDGDGGQGNCGERH